MTKYILEWGWHTAPTPNASSISEGTAYKTLLGGAEPEEIGPQIAAAGDLKCEAMCASGGSYGTTGTYRHEGKVMCRACAVKATGAGGLPGSKQNEMLRSYEIK